MVKRADSVFEPVIIEGEWWLPETPDACCYGTLNYDVTGIRILKLWGRLSKQGDCEQKYSVIYGTTKGGVEITIFDSVITRTSKTESRFTTYHQELSFLQFWTGRHFASKNDVKLEVFYFGINNLEDWHDQRNFFDDDQDGEIIIKYVKPLELLLFEDGWVKISLYYEWSLSQIIAQVDAGLEHAARISISAKHGKIPFYNAGAGIPHIEFYVENITNFFWLAIGRNIFTYNHRALLETITETVEELRRDIPTMADKIKENREYRLEGDYYFARSIECTQRKTLLATDMILPFKSAKEDLKDLITKWFDQEPLISIAIDDYIGFRNRINSFTKATLPLLIYAIEGLHRSLHPELDEKHKEKAESLIEQCPNAIKKDISKLLLKWCPLPERLHGLLKEYKSVFPCIYDFKEKIVSDLVKLRNNASHAKGEKKVINFSLEWAYAHILSMLLAAMLLEIAGMRKEKISEQFNVLKVLPDVIRELKQNK